MPALRTVHARPAPRQAAAVTPLLVLVAVAVAGGYWWFAGRSADEDNSRGILLHTVEQDDFVLEITERGEIESAGVTEVRSQVRSKNTAGVSILKIVPEGTVVAEGDFLVQLDNSALKEERTNQQIVVNTSEAVVIEARNLFDTAKIAKKEYLEGTFVQEKQTIESEIFVAEENLNRAREYYEFSKKLASKGYVNELQLEADQFAVEKSLKELEAARTKLRVLEEFTKAKMLKQLESDIATAQAKWQSEMKSAGLDTEKLRDIEDQITKCEIFSPKAGTVVYAHERDVRGQGDFVVEEGAIVRERQAIIRLPDPSAMRVQLKVNESLIQYVRKDMPAEIRPVGIGDHVLSGKVVSVNRYAEPTGWRKANVKEYKAYVSVNSPPAELRSGMTTSVTIRCADVPDAVQAPVQAVYAHGEDYYCFVYAEAGWEARRVACGPSNDRFFVIEDGLAPGDRVAMNPREYREVVDLPELAPEKAQRAVPLSGDEPGDVATAEDGKSANSGA
ncbi:MAG: HlyD family efflux transporter periplasmic adaptor subunit [Planctomycetota bacterium]